MIVGIGIKYNAVGCSNPYSFGPKNSFPRVIHVHHVHAAVVMAASAKEITVKKWKSSFSWLGFEVDECNSVSNIWCSVCRKYKDRIISARNYSPKYIDGTTNIKLDMVKTHDRSDQHKLALRISLEDSGNRPGPSQESALVKAFSVQEKGTRDKLVKLIETSYFIAKEELPFALFPKIVDLEKKHGVDLGNSYTYDKACGDFIDCIEQVEVNKLGETIANSKYFSILIDGSTDAANNEKEIVFVLFLENGHSSLKFIR